MRLTVILFAFLLSVSAWSGTFRGDFEDGDWKGWEEIATVTWDTNVADRISVVESVLNLD